MKTGAWVIVLLLLSGCVSSRSSCDRRLTPINAPVLPGARPRVGGS